MLSKEALNRVQVDLDKWWGMDSIRWNRLMYVVRFLRKLKVI